MKVVFITKGYFKCDAPADAKCHVGKQERAAAQGQDTPSSTPRPAPAASCTAGAAWMCHLEKHPPITVKREDMGKFWSFSWSQAAFSSQNTLWLTSPASALALLVGITLGTLRYPNSQSVLVGLCPYSLFQKKVQPPAVEVHVEQNIFNGRNPTWLQPSNLPMVPPWGERGVYESVNQLSFFLGKEL